MVCFIDNWDIEDTINFMTKKLDGAHKFVMMKLEVGVIEECDFHRWYLRKNRSEYLREAIRWYNQRWSNEPVTEEQQKLIDRFGVMKGGKNVGKGRGVG